MVLFFPLGNKEVKKETEEASTSIPPTSQPARHSCFRRYQIQTCSRIRHTYTYRDHPFSPCTSCFNLHDSNPFINAGTRALSSPYLRCPRHREWRMENEVGVLVSHRRGRVRKLAEESLGTCFPGWKIDAVSLLASSSRMVRGV